VLAAHKLGMDLIPTIELAYLTAAQRQAYKITDNKLALNAGWNAEMLRLELGDLKELGFELALTGFDRCRARRAVRGQDCGADRSRRNVGR